ncbi:SPOR domain-containing protein [bacterium]|nr:SPOR domain-containing protein [bacterium]
MKDEGYFQFSLGQIMMAVVTLVVMGIVVFYVGARFGPKLLWGINIDFSRQHAILPQEIPEEELKKLIAEHKDQFKLTFYDELEREKQNLEMKDAEKPFVPLPADAIKEEAVPKEENKVLEKTTAEGPAMETPKKDEPVIPSVSKPVPAPATTPVKVAEKEIPLPKKEEVKKSEPVLVKAPPVEVKAEDIIPENKPKSYTLHVGQYTDIKKMEKMQERLEKGGYKTIQKSFQSSSGETVYVLQIGQYASQDIAEKTSQNIRKNFMVISQVVER